MEIRQLIDAETSTYSYLIWDKETKEAALIDSVKEQVTRDIQYIEELGLSLKYLMETHIHADHITGAGDLRKYFSAQSIVHKHSGSQCADLLVEDGHNIFLGTETIKVLYTPGHTNTDITFSITGTVFTGDTLLIRGSGRTDFQSGSPGDGYDSITQKIFSLPENTIIYPGHDYHGFTCSSVAEEKAFNPRLGQGKTRAEYIAIMNAMDLPKPAKIDEAVPGNLSCGLDT